MSNNDDQYKASNFIKKNNDDHQYHSSNFIRKKEQPNTGWLERNASSAEKYINEPIEALGRSARDVVGGFGQGLANIGPGLYNLGASGINALGGSVPKSPMIDVVPHGPSATAGEIASFFTPGSLLKALSKAPAFMHTTRAAMKIPMIAESIKHASNVLSKSPSASRIAGNALLGGAYSPDNPLLGMGIGGAGGAIGEVASKGYSGIKNSLQNTDILKNILSNPKSLLTTKKSIPNSLLAKHDFLENRASDAFNHVSKQVNDLGINHVPVEQHLPKDFFEQAKHYFPNTRASADLLNNAKEGDYNALRKMQGDLYKRAKKNLSSQFEADNLKGAEMLEKRNDINQTISNHLKETGHHDLSELLEEARKDWRTLQKTYYNENVGNSLVKMFDKNVRKIPKNLVNLLSEESIPMRNILNFHPGLEQKIIGHKIGQNVLKKTGKYGFPLATAVGGYELGKR